MFTSSLAWNVITLLVARRFVSVVIVHAKAQPTCDIYSDPCPYQLDGACAVDEGYCQSGDCFDCSDCSKFKLDCAGCVANGCYYCASEGLCYSEAVNEDYWNQIFAQTPLRTSCNTTAEWANSCEPSPKTVFSDPLYGANQWIYDLMSVEEVWKQGFRGKGVMIRVNDPDGVDSSHPELSANFDVDASCGVYLPPQQLPDGTAPHHGTAVASLAVGGANNGECAVGIAPDATLSACRGPILRHDDSNPTFNFLDGLETTHVSVNSWGFDACTIHADKDASVSRSNGGGRLLETSSCPFNKEGGDNPCVHCQELDSQECEHYVAQYCQINGEEEHVACAEYLDIFMDCRFNALSEAGQRALARGVTEGRNGLGIVYMIAAGNEYEIWEDVNFEGWLNTRFTTVVAAVGKDGKHASYSTPGAAVLISGPGGDKESLTNNVVADIGGSGCRDAAFGSSFATPSVAGVVALILEANPLLSYRDVQGILASTAHITDPDNPTWTTNGAGLHHSNLYGFGLVNALAAVEAAKHWVNYGEEKQITVDSGPVKVPIVDDANTSAMSIITLKDHMDMTTEAVAVYLQLDYESRGDLEIILTSPLGTESVLSPGKRPENTHLERDQRWKLLTVRTYGEKPTGNWTLSLRDLKPGRPRECIDLPYFSTVNDPEVPGGLITLKCEAMFQFCQDGALVVPDIGQALDDETGRSPVEACCVCGGGGAPVSNVNALVSYKMIVFGHENRVFVSSQGGSTSNNSGGIRESLLFGAMLLSVVFTILIHL